MESKCVPLVKICGLTSVDDALYVNRYNADLAGFVMFYEKSRRCVSGGTAERIKSALDKSIKTVAVTVSPTIRELHIIEELGFDYIQIHGELYREVLDNSRIPIFRAINVKDSIDSGIEEDDRIGGYVLDGRSPGSGEVFDWSLIEKFDRKGKLFMLAGGLNADNVAEAVRRTAPDIVDVSSGVEYTDRAGKDPEKIRKFIENARHI